MEITKKPIKLDFMGRLPGLKEPHLSHETNQGMKEDYKTSLPGTGSSTGEAETYNARGGCANEGYDTMSAPATAREGAWHVNMTLKKVAMVPVVRPVPAPVPAPIPEPADDKWGIRALFRKIAAAFNFNV
jgi:hypothetical protein